VSSSDQGDDATDPLIGRELASRYRVEALLGKGAMGAVYRARHIKVGRSFAVKVLHQRLLTDAKLKKRFERESELAGKLHHINVVGVVDVGETDDGIHFMVMEYANGKTLGSIMDGPLDPERTVEIVKQLLDGLDHAHAHGLVHRDFKPENVIIEVDHQGNERPRIVDFGIAILRDQASTPNREDRLTTAGLVLGTPHYMAPEHAMGEGVDHRIDLFALGVIVYEMLTGRMPYDGDGVDVARANLLHETPPMGVRVPTVIVDPLLEAFTRKLMEKKPDARPANAKAARQLLELIERDRMAAATALGISFEVAIPLPAPAQVVSLPRPVPDPEPVRALAPTMAAPTSTPRAPTTDPIGRRPIALPTRRLVGIGAGIAAVIALVVIVKLATRSHEDPKPTVATAPSIALPDAGALELAIDAAVTAPTDAAPAPVVIDAPPTKIEPVIKPGTTNTPATKPRPRPPGTKPGTGSNAVIAPVVVVDTSASAVAQLYGLVGRELKQLDTAKGSGATADLWPKYLRIRINDVITTPEKRSEAQRTLAQLHREIAAH
jgi:tRNA A-37 threonylcarbamoyl transferase component Bud32